MVIRAYIHEDGKKVGVWSVCFYDELACLLFFLLTFHSKLKNFGINWIEGFYGGKKLVELLLYGMEDLH
jgi:hypothetical protein